MQMTSGELEEAGETETERSLDDRLKEARQSQNETAETVALTRPEFDAIVASINRLERVTKELEQSKADADDENDLSREWSTFDFWAEIDDHALRDAVDGHRLTDNLARKLVWFLPVSFFKNRKGDLDLTEEILHRALELVRDARMRRNRT